MALKTTEPCNRRCARCDEGQPHVRTQPAGRSWRLTDRHQQLAEAATPAKTGRELPKRSAGGATLGSCASWGAPVDVCDELVPLVVRLVRLPLVRRVGAFEKPFDGLAVVVPAGALSAFAKEEKHLLAYRTHPQSCGPVRPQSYQSGRSRRRAEPCRTFESVSDEEA